MAFLNWRSVEHYDHGGDQPCVICDQPTPLRSDRGRPVHKVCAETWTDTRPKSETGTDR